MRPNLTAQGGAGEGAPEELVVNTGSGRVVASAKELPILLKHLV